MILNTYIINPIRPDYIERCLETLYKHTDMTNCKVIVVDQTMDGLKLDMDKVHLVLRPHRNLGFSKSMNEGIIHGLRWESEYITCMNDDIEFIDLRWWDGIIETFAQDPKIMAVNPMSPREPGWGYGLPHGKYLDLLDYQESYDHDQYNWLLEGDFSHIKKEKGFPASFPDKKNGVIDAIATWCTVFKRESFYKFGMWEERFYPGGAEDYDMNARVYREGYRMVGTTKSWVWHWWGSSKDTAEHKGKSLPIMEELRWADTTSLWPPEKNNGQSYDPWGKWTDENGNKHPMYRDPIIGIIEI